MQDMRKPTTKLFFVFIFSMILLGVAGATSFFCDQLIFSDSFDYTDAYTNHGWDSFDNGVCTDAQLPPKPNITGTFGVSLTGCGANADYRIDKIPFPSAFTGSNLHTISFNAEIRQNTSAEPAFFVWLGSSGSQFQFGLYANRSILVTPVFASGVKPCNGGFLDYNVSGEYYLAFNMSDLNGAGSYSVYKDGGIAGDCSKKNMSNNNVIDQIILFHSVKASTFTNQYLDNLNICNSTMTNASSCAYPALFCDDFNYNYKISTNGWLPYSYTGVIQDDLYPISGQLELIDASLRSPAHTTGLFPTDYRISDSGIIGTTDIAPVFSSEFDMLLEEGDFYYAAGDTAYVGAYMVKAHVEADNYNISWYALNNDSTYTLLCANCTNVLQYEKVKINAYFKSHTSYFNSTIPFDYIDVFYGTTKIGTKAGFLCNTLVNGISSSLACPIKLNYYQLFKNTDTKVYVDNYKVMVGTDATTPNVESFYNQAYNAVNETAAYAASDDIYANAQSLWFQLGLRSAASRIFAGLMIMFIAAIIIIGVHLYVHVQPSPITIALVEVILVFVLTYIGLMPIWIVILFGFMLFIGFCLYLFKSFKTSGNG